MESRFCFSAMTYLVAVAAIVLPLGTANADTVVVPGTTAIWNYVGNDITQEQSQGAPPGYQAGVPIITQITPGSGQVLTFSSVVGTVNLTDSGPYGHGPDGGPSNPPGGNTVSVSGMAGLSGSIASTSAGLFGVFLNGQEAASGHVVPATLSYSTAADYTLASYSPLIDQVFFIGDGLTGTKSGTQQTFIVPSDATGLVLGIVDAGGYSSAPGAYFDNNGFFTATFDINSAVPEPSTWAMMLFGFAAVGFMAFRRNSHMMLKAD